MRVFSIATISLALVATTLSACSTTDFRQRAIDEQIDPAEPGGGLRLTFFGTSSFLIDDGTTQLLIDGFVTREKHRYFRRFGPSEQQIRTVIAEHRICRAPGAPRKAEDPASCRNVARRGLELVIPTHGHYDHALDAPYFAAWSGATLVADPSILSVVKASQAYPGFSLPQRDWLSVKTIPPFADGAQTAHLAAGAFSVTLIKTPHGKNPTTPLLSGTTSAALKFPSSLWALKEGTAFSVFVAHRGRTMLFVPSAGDIGDIFRQAGTKADIIFLGIAGLGFKPPRARSRYWNDVVRTVGAKRVIPIHWDDDQVPLNVADGDTFKPASPRRFDATLRIFDELARECGLEIAFPPPARAFDPFKDLETRLITETKFQPRCE
ncbi:MBL fold metallo-hydrolase [Oricola cellulosilytica]|uniref:MBL fold metallo-hydrolase n=1 Tax=Oricola cellulosilytica TaxID=1429082 RepID=UPI0013049E68|nr:MBL fold metallo-hydrolase [Oricola cellulosilytica]